MLCCIASLSERPRERLEMGYRLCLFLIFTKTLTFISCFLFFLFHIFSILEGDRHKRGGKKNIFTPIFNRDRLQNSKQSEP